MKLTSIIQLPIAKFLMITIVTAFKNTPNMQRPFTSNIRTHHFSLILTFLTRKPRSTPTTTIFKPISRNIASLPESHRHPSIHQLMFAHNTHLHRATQRLTLFAIRLNTKTRIFQTVPTPYPSSVLICPLPPSHVIKFQNFLDQSGSISTKCTRPGPTTFTKPHCTISVTNVEHRTCGQAQRYTRFSAAISFRFTTSFSLRTASSRNSRTSTSLSSTKQYLSSPKNIYIIFQASLSRSIDIMSVPINHESTNVEHDVSIPKPTMKPFSTKGTIILSMPS